MKRIKLANRLLPDYTRGEETMNMVTHIVGGGFGILILVLCVLRAAIHANTAGIVGSAIYGCSMVALYTMSSVYHGMRSGTAKKVLQVLDHCTIYFLIAGTYTPIMLCAICPLYPLLGWSMLAGQWLLLALAVTLTAIDLKQYNILSMVCYIGMGWALLLILPQAMTALSRSGFYWLLSGGIAYTVGAVLYGIGSKIRWMHSVFHIFVVLGSLLQFVAIFLYVL